MVFPHQTSDGPGPGVEENSRHFGIDEVSGNLRAHHPGTEHGYLANDELGLRHGFLWLQTD